MNKEQLLKQYKNLSSELQTTLEQLELITRKEMFEKVYYANLICFCQTGEFPELPPNSIKLLNSKSY